MLLNTGLVVPTVEEASSGVDEDLLRIFNEIERATYHFNL